jgi:hypothetical protein
MKNPEKVLSILTEIALEHYQEKAKPDRYATTAAHIVAKASAAKFSREAADAAAFVAAIQDMENRLNLVKYSADLAEASAKRHKAEQYYHARTKVHAGKKAIKDDDNVEISFAETIEAIDRLSLKKPAAGVYDDAYKENAAQAMNAASASYPYAYACARSAYVYSVAMAARYPEGERRIFVFKNTLTQRLKRELTHQPIEPSFFMQIMCSDLMKMLGIFFLAVGLIALTLGVAGLAVPAVGAVIANIGLTSTSVTVAGAAASTLASGLFVGRFFTHRHWQHKNEESHKAIEAMNNPM